MLSLHIKMCNIRFSWSFTHFYNSLFFSLCANSTVDGEHVQASQIGKKTLWIITHEQKTSYSFSAITSYYTVKNYWTTAADYFHISVFKKIIWIIIPSKNKAARQYWKKMSTDLFFKVFGYQCNRVKWQNIVWILQHCDGGSFCSSVSCFEGIDTF